MNYKFNIRQINYRTDFKHNLFNLNIIKKLDMLLFDLI